jgi:2-dehydro-3-deoxyphosphooctonate aldolase (KDO 8-P synthase)
VPGAVRIGGVAVGGGAPLAFIAGPCAIESRAQALEAAAAIAEAAAALGVADRVVFKGSFDKANRTRGDAFRGVGIDEGLSALVDVRARTGLPVLTDVHEAWQAEPAARAADALQVPAFLCRQTDLLAACGATGRPVNVKKGQFVAAEDMRFAVEKLGPGAAALLTERGTFFGYRDLVVDFRGLLALRALAPVVYDVTHSVQSPGGAAGGGASGGDRRFALPLARAAVAVGVDALYAEVHPDPARARSDAATQLDPAGWRALVEEALALTGGTRAGIPRP